MHRCTAEGFHMQAWLILARASVVVWAAMVLANAAAGRVAAATLAGRLPGLAEARGTQNELDIVPIPGP